MKLFKFRMFMMKRLSRNIVLLLVLIIPYMAYAQIGEHRNDLAIGFNGGYVMSNVGFTPTVSQTMHGGLTGGFTMRYTCGKYFKSICSYCFKEKF